MSQDHLNSQPGDDNHTGQRGEPFESDTQKIVKRHLENKDDVITEEDIRNIRVGMTPPLDEATEEALEEREEKTADRKAIDEDEIKGGQKLTPWDVVEPEE
ncbi:MAG TPA: hypothetical protein VJ499_13795 [Flavisolibacter sp.]|nr:hypothetical protein [Flavisolibacter sp.]